MSLKQTITLNNGVKMPQFGLGVFKVADDVAASTVKFAIESGYRHIDTAAVYKNEVGVGQGIIDSGIKREDLFVTTKVWNSDQGYETTLAAFEASRQRLQLDYIDLYLVHWPVKGKIVETYRALEELYAKGLVRAIGVSNFKEHHLEEIMQHCKVVPAVNQVEYHPLLTQEPLKQYCDKHNIPLTAWSPLMQGNLDLPLLQELAEKYGKSPAQIVLRWDIQQGVITIPKSTTPSRIVENADIFDFELSAEDMTRISALNKDSRFGPDPDLIDF